MYSCTKPAWLSFFCWIFFCPFSERQRASIFLKYLMVCSVYSLYTLYILKTRRSCFQVLIVNYGLPYSSIHLHLNNPQLFFFPCEKPILMLLNPLKLIYESSLCVDLLPLSSSASLLNGKILRRQHWRLNIIFTNWQQSTDGIDRAWLVFNTLCSFQIFSV